MPLRPKEVQLVRPEAFPKPLRQASLLEKWGFNKMATALRKDFNERVNNGDPSTGVAV